MSQILGVKFAVAAKIHYYLPGKNNCRVNNYVIANNKKGIFLGKIVKIIVSDSKEFLDNNKYELEPIIRIATRADIFQYKQNRQKAKYAKQLFLNKIKKYNIDMKIINIEYTLDGRKVIFYFSADGKIDFRDLVKDLAATLKNRIELRQIGVRDQSKTLGGLGICGRPFCCSTFLRDFGVVSIKMAKEQGLSLNPVKLSGTCGRLMCCLQYEQDTYEEMIKNTPNIGDIVRTKDGEGKIIDINLITGFLKIAINNNDNNDFQVYHKDDVTVIKKV